MSSSKTIDSKLKLWLEAAETYARDANRQYARIKRQLQTLSTDEQVEALDQIGKKSI